MEGICVNDDALICWIIAQNAVNSGNRSRALKFITKARNLNPALALFSVDEIFSKLQFLSHSHSSTKPPPPSSSYTQEQMSIVREIKFTKDYYEILGLDKNKASTYTAKDIRKAYRKLSLRVHPDKNMAPGADEAFMVVSKAFQCLNNEDSRIKYDARRAAFSDAVFEKRRAWQANTSKSDGGGGGPRKGGSARMQCRGGGGGGNHGTNECSSWICILVQLLVVVGFILLKWGEVHSQEFM